MKEIEEEYEMRTDQEIIDRIEEVSSTDFFGTQVGELVCRLTFEAALPLLKPDETLESWGDVHARDEESVKVEMLSYMEFAWNKANNCRGLSASRSLDHMSAWLWLLGMDEAAEKIQGYTYYGKPELRAICEAFDWDWKQWDNGVWVNNEDDDGIPPPESVEPLKNT